MEIRRHDEEEVYEASRTGSVVHLNRLIEKDPDILRRVSLQTGKTPLHVSALLGHAEFTKALCTNNPKLAERVDADGRTPLHLASAEGHKETVEALLPVYVDACLRYDEKGRIPLHYAAMNGEVEVLQKLIDKNPESIYVKVENKSKETVLHLCIIHKKLECLKLLVERVDNNGEFLNSRAGCDGGVTILHLALMLRQIKTIRYLLSVDAIRAEAIGVNGMSLTMLDILEYSSVAREDFSRSLEIQQILMDAGLIRRQSNENDNPNSAVAAAAVVVSPSPRTVKKKKKGSKPPGWFWRKLMIWLGYPHEWVKETRGSLMVVATVISTMTFQDVVNPAGRLWVDSLAKTSRTVWRENNDTVTTLGQGKDPMDYFPSFIAYNTVSFLASLTVTLLLISRFPLHDRLSTWLLSMSVCVTLAFLALTYLKVLSMIGPNYGIQEPWSLSAIFIILWIVLLVIGGVLHTLRLLIWVMKWLQPMYFKSTSGLKNMITTGSFSHKDPTHFDENDAPAVV
ncbi:ankyrin repeat-containing protein BDA1-like [Pyrus x bretschneideri]|uniref:ankyrin repeat-containing protein BDA1-like n=1 Tax=Pyrus x bretschneideri TaxID=225117 RepID=UPI00203024FD|nr:ankyrin repeat-containing protein BDA1-like [Pyrus x bretschneideri]